MLSRDFRSQGNFISRDGPDKDFCQRNLKLMPFLVCSSGLCILWLSLLAPCPLLRGWTQGACSFALSLPPQARGCCQSTERWSSWCWGTMLVLVKVMLGIWFKKKKKKGASHFHGWAKWMLSVIDYGWWELIEALCSAWDHLYVHVWRQVQCIHVWLIGPFLRFQAASYAYLSAHEWQ